MGHPVWWRVEGVRPFASANDNPNLSDDEAVGKDGAPGTRVGGWVLGGGAFLLGFC
jgi:hypothetical protein